MREKSCFPLPILRRKVQVWKIFVIVVPSASTYSLVPYHQHKNIYRPELELLKKNWNKTNGGKRCAQIVCSMSPRTPEVILAMSFLIPPKVPSWEVGVWRAQSDKRCHKDVPYNRRWRRARRDANSGWTPAWTFYFWREVTRGQRCKM